MFLKKTILIGVSIAFMSSFSTVAAAEQTEAEQQGYWSLSGKKFGRGVYNSTLGWMELPNGVGKVGKEHGVGAAATWGVLHGMGRAIQRTAVGVFEIVTFPLKVPGNFDPILESKIGGEPQP